MVSHQMVKFINKDNIAEVYKTHRTGNVDSMRFMMRHLYRLQQENQDQR